MFDALKRGYIEKIIFGIEDLEGKDDSFQSLFIFKIHCKNKKLRKKKLKFFFSKQIEMEILI